MVAVAIIGAGAVGAAATAYSANKAANAQTEAANIAAGIAKDSASYAKGVYNTTYSDLAPYRELGTKAANDLSSRLDYLTSPIVMDQNALEQTPGYQFTKTQGLKAVQNSAAARGLGVSGAALKGAATFATGLADQTYQTQFNLENINRSNAFNRLQALVSGGQTATVQGGAVGTGTAGPVVTAGSQAGGAAIGAGNARAAAINATGGAFSKLASDVGGYYAYKGLYDNSSNNPGNVNNSRMVFGPGGSPLPTALYEEAA